LIQPQVRLGPILDGGREAGLDLERLVVRVERLVVLAEFPQRKSAYSDERRIAAIVVLLAAALFLTAVIRD